MARTGFFVIHIAGQSYGIKAPNQSMLACSVDEVVVRITGRGTHQARFSEAAAIDIANAYTDAVYLNNNGDEKYFGLSEAQFTKTLNSNSLVWAPDGDEAFDDGSYVLQFDVGDRVRLVAFKRPDGLVDPATVREVFLFGRHLLLHPSPMAGPIRDRMGVASETRLTKTGDFAH